MVARRGSMVVDRWSTVDIRWSAVRAVLQRVSQARVSVDGRSVAAIGRGLLILLGIGPRDGEGEAQALAEKCAGLRMFEDDGGKTNLSIRDIRGEALVVSQFTLYADTRKGRRPSFTEAAAPEAAEPLVTRFAQKLESLGVPAKTGLFGAHMQVELTNDGPFTIMLEHPQPASLADRAGGGKPPAGR
jgi:D-tyrosyl-tRNA(Tyr) deacylase